MPTIDEFRRAMGLFATGVTVVTTAHDGEVRGMTANSVTSVSLEPLSVLVCVNRQAITHRVVSTSGAFCVNILREGQEDLARACAQPDSPEAELRGVAYRFGKTGAPVLNDALGYLDCQIAASLEFGTHTVFIAETVDLGMGDGEPLLFYGGQYTRFPPR